MKFISEAIDIHPLFEGKGAEKTLHIQGVFLSGGCVNRNGRYYPPEILNREASRYIEEHVIPGKGWGELGHPDSVKVNLERVSHRVVSLKQDGHNWVGKARVINEGMGKILHGLMASGGSLGASSRGLGSLKEGKNGVNVVQPDYHLAVCCDVVSDPSAPTAFINGLMEGVEWFHDASNGAYFCERVETLRNRLRRKSTRQIEESVVDTWRQIIEIANERRT
jgi:hypothetical protein